MVSALEDSELGRLRWNEELGWFEGSAIQDGESYEVQVSVEDEDDPHASLGDALRGLKDARARVAEFKAAAASQLLALYNEEWRDEGASEKNEGEFIACLALSSITGYPDGSIEVSFHDGDLFAGHLILVSVNDGRVSDVSIAG